MLVIRRTHVIYIIIRCLLRQAASALRCLPVLPPLQIVKYTERYVVAVKVYTPLLRLVLTMVGALARLVITDEADMCNKAQTLVKVYRNTGLQPYLICIPDTVDMPVSNRSVTKDIDILRVQCRVTCIRVHGDRLVTVVGTLPAGNKTCSPFVVETIAYFWQELVSGVFLSRLTILVFGTSYAEATTYINL